MSKKIKIINIIAIVLSIISIILLFTTLKPCEKGMKCRPFTFIYVGLLGADIFFCILSLIFKKKWLSIFPAIILPIGMLIDNSDEPYAEEIADIVFNQMRKGLPMSTTTELRQAIEDALCRLPKDEREQAVKKSCARVFQALRIDVNSEFEVLYSFLEKLPDILNPGGRAAILTFHSGEDRLVKTSFKELYKQGIYSEVSTDVIRPSAEECRINPRSKSTKMRWAIK